VFLYNVNEIRQAIYEHCEETGLDFNDFVAIFKPQIESPEVFDIFFEYPFHMISDDSKDKRIAILIDIFSAYLDG